jgi:hypothetical protein
MKTQTYYKKWDLVILITLFICAMIVCYGYCFFGSDHSDGPFWYLTYTTQWEIPNNWYTFGSAAAGHFLNNLLHPNLISYRFVNVSLNLCALILGCIPLINLKLCMKKWLTIAILSILYYTNFNLNLLSADTFTAFITAIIFILGYYYSKKPTLSLVLFISLASALSYSIRLPNVCNIIPLIFLIHYVGRPQNGSHIVTFLLCTTLFYVFLFWLSSIKHITFLANDESHSFFSLIKSSSKSLFITSFWASIIYFISYNDNLKITVKFILISVIYFINFNNWYGASIGNSLTQQIIILLPGIFHLYKKSNYNNKFIIFSTLLGLTTIAGSNTGLLKLANGFIFMVPLIIHQALSIKHAHLICVVLICTNSVNKLFFSPTYEDYRVPKLIKEYFHKPNHLYHPKTRFILTSHKNITCMSEYLLAIRENYNKKTAIINTSYALMIKYLVQDSIVVKPSYFQDVSTKTEIANTITMLHERQISKIILPNNQTSKKFINNNHITKNFKITKITSNIIVLRRNWDN